MSDDHRSRTRRTAGAILGGLATGGLLGAVFAAQPAEAAEVPAPSVRHQFATAFAPGAVVPDTQLAVTIVIDNP